MIRRALVLGALLTLAPALSQAAIRMMVEGISGPSKTTGYSGWFELNSLSWSIDRSKTAEPHEIAVTLPASAAVATLIQLSAAGVSAKKMVFDTLHGFAPDASFLLDSRVTCEDPTIRASTTAGSSDDRSNVALHIRCGRLVWELYDYGKDSKVAALAGKGSWNFRTNTP